MKPLSPYGGHEQSPVGPNENGRKVHPSKVKGHAHMPQPECLGVPTQHSVQLHRRRDRRLPHRASQGFFTRSLSKRVCVRDWRGKEASVSALPKNKVADREAQAHCEFAEHGEREASVLCHQAKVKRG